MTGGKKDPAGGRKSQSPTRNPRVERTSSPTEEQYGNLQEGAGTSGGADQGATPPALPPKMTAADPHKTTVEMVVEGGLDILTGFFNLTPKERDEIADDQLKTIKPTQSDVIRAAIVGRVEKTSFEATKALIQLMAYEGFNPIIIINELHRKQVAHNQNPNLIQTWDLKAENRIFNITEKADLAVDVVFLTTLFLTRGNNVRKILFSIDKETKVVLAKKVNTYGIKNDTDDDAARRRKNERIPLGSKDITLSRIAAPHITLAIVLNTSVMGKVEQTCLKLQYKITYKEDKDIPAILTHGLIPALIPKADQTRQLNLKFYCFMFNVEQSVTLQTPAAKRLIVNEPMTKLLESAEKFVNAAINGPLNDDKSRIRLLTELGLEEPQGEIARWIKVGAELYSKASIYIT